MRFPKVSRFAAIVSALWCVSFVAFGARHTTPTEFLLLPLTLLFLGTTLIAFNDIFVDWSLFRWRALLPFGICVGTFFLSVVMARMAHHLVFLWVLPSYERVVHRVESGEFPVSTELTRMPWAKSEARLAYSVSAMKDAHGDLLVLFLTEGSFPVRHGGYLYSASGTIPPGSVTDKDWPGRRKVRSQWFHVAD
jgi:hypothetical protein